jgi:hypothetical protein
MASIHALAVHLLPDQTESGRALSGQVRIATLRDATVSRAAAQETYYIEDGWVFREHHGKYVECICRTEEIPAVPAHHMPVFQLR